MRVSRLVRRDIYIKSLVTQSSDLAKDFDSLIEDIQSMLVQVHVREIQIFNLLAIAFSVAVIQ